MSTRRTTTTRAASRRPSPRPARRARCSDPGAPARSPDQLRPPIQEDSLDFRKLEDSLDWLEGAFLDIKHEGEKLRLVWKVPIFGSKHDLISWKLDRSFGRVPVRSLTDYKIAAADRTDKRKTLQGLSLDAIDIGLSLLAPRSVEAGGGVIMFGGDDQPGMVDLKVSGSIHDRGPGELKGAIGSIDTTIKDVHLGPAKLTADRLHLDGLDQLEVAFNGFSPQALMMIVHRVTATNLAVQIGTCPAPRDSRRLDQRTRPRRAQLASVQARIAS